MQTGFQIPKTNIKRNVTQSAKMFNILIKMEANLILFAVRVVCSGKISDGRENIEDNITEVKSMVKSIKSLVQW